MYVPVWHGLSPMEWMRPASRTRPPYPFNAPHRTSGYLARNLIYHLFTALRLRQRDVVLAPDYHHGNEIMAMRAAGARLHFYPVRPDLQLDLDALAALCRKTHPRVLFVIHYLGWPQPIQELLALCREHDMLLVEDCALALLSEAGGKPLGSFGDYAIFCLYKTLALPNGGLLVQNQGGLPELDDLCMASVSFLSTAARNTDLSLKWVRGRWAPLGQAGFALKRFAGRALSALSVARVPVGNTGFDTDKVNLDMSPSCHRLLKRFDYEAIRERRRDNYLRLAHHLRAETALLKPDLEPGICPLFLPILVADKHEASMALLERGVETMEFWNQGDPEAEAEASGDVRYLRDHVLELPIHQDLGEAQMDYIAAQVRGLPLRLLSVHPRR